MLTVLMTYRRGSDDETIAMTLSASFILSMEAIIPHEVVVVDDTICDRSQRRGRIETVASG